MIHNLGKALRTKREELGLTQEYLALKLCLANTRSYGRYEDNSRVPDIYTLAKLSDIYGITIDKLVGNNQPEELRNVSQWAREYGKSRQMLMYWVKKLDLGKYVASHHSSGMDLVLTRNEMNEILDAISNKNKPIKSKEDWI